MTTPDTETFIGNDMQLDVLREFRILRSQSILLDCHITVSTILFTDSMVKAKDGEVVTVHSTLLAVNFVNLRDLLNTRARTGSVKVELKRYPVK